MVRRSLEDLEERCQPRLHLTILDRADASSVGLPDPLDESLSLLSCANAIRLDGRVRLRESVRDPTAEQEDQQASGGEEKDEHEHHAHGSEITFRPRIPSKSRASCVTRGASARSAVAACQASAQPIGRPLRSARSLTSAHARHSDGVDAPTTNRAKYSSSRDRRASPRSRFRAQRSS